jgi:hypothetical protein
MGLSNCIYFLFVGPANSSQCFHLHVCQRLSFPIKDSKTVLPSKVIIIYGIEVDSEKMECRLSQDKIVKINTVLISAMHRTSCFIFINLFFGRLSLQISSLVMWSFLSATLFVIGSCYINQGVSTVIF